MPVTRKLLAAHLAGSERGRLATLDHNGLLSADQELGEDVRKVFVQLTSLGKVGKLHKLLQAPFSLHQTLIKKIQREAEHAEAGKPARIVVKVNAVAEPQLIQALYRASMAGVMRRHGAHRSL